MQLPRSPAGPAAARDNRERANFFGWNRVSRNSDFSMKLLWTIAVVTVAGLAQAPADLFEKAPPDVDNSLRERVKAFYQCHIDGTYRKAEKYVAEESQDFFYQIQKQRYDSCELLKIVYADNFTKATVTQVCKGKWNINGDERSVSMPLSSGWVRKEGGEWFWQHIPAQQVPTPFGQMDYSAASKEKGGAGPNASKPASPTGLGIPTDMKSAAEMLMKQVVVDKTEVKLSSYEKSSDTITITNNTGGAVKLSFDYEAVVPGFKAELEQKEVPAGGKTTLKFTMVPKDRVAKPTLNTRILVEPLFQQFPVTIVFGIPPEVEKLIPKK